MAIVTFVVILGLYPGVWQSAQLLFLEIAHELSQLWIESLHARTNIM